MSITGIGSSMSSSVIGQMMSRMQTRGSSESEISAVSGKQKPDLAALVTQLDANSSGSLEADEITDLAEKISQATGVSTDLTEFMATYDTDDSSSLSTDEAVAALKANAPQQGPPPPPPGGMGGMKGSMESDLVSAADENGDGTISEDEAKALVDFINEATGSSLSAADFMAAADSDNENGVSLEEAVAGVEAHRPEDPSSSQAEGNSITAMAMESYMTMATMGADNQQQEALYSLLGSSDTSVSRMA